MPPVPIDVPVDRGGVMTPLPFAEDFHRQHFDVGQLRFWTALPQLTAERHHPVGVIDQQIQQDKCVFQAHGHLLKTPWADLAGCGKTFSFG
jgi:hypothetical protein